MTKKWQKRKKYPDDSNMRTSLVAFFALAHSIIFGGCALILIKVVFGFLQAAYKTPLSQWGSRGWLLLVVIGVLAYITQFSGKSVLYYGRILLYRKRT